MLRRPAVQSLTPQVSIAIAVDTAWIAGQAVNGGISEGVFLMDNRVRSGSSQEGTLSLHTVCSTGSLIGFQVVPIDGGAFGDQVVITGFADINGEVFTGAGHPVPSPPPGNGPSGSYWIGQAMKAGTETYQIEIEVTVGQLQPVRYYVWWDAVLTAS
ncbi:MAG: hypothetical protein JOZ54_11365 [Acidobacteria bacterium]|nr:hypothetical protein [Acidobacteriota bacterium]